MDTQFLMNLLLDVQVPSKELREALGPSFDLVCRPHAKLAAERIIREELRWQDRKGRWLCSLHDSENCGVCRG